MDKKRVNVKIAGPIYTVKPPIVRTMIDVELSIGDIRNCICAKATVEEILDNGKLLRLNLYNYNKDNNPKKKAKPATKPVPPSVKATKVETPQPKPEPKKVEAVNVKIQEKQQPKEEVKVQPQEVKKEQPKVAEKPKEQPKATSVAEKALEALEKINEEKK